MKNDNGKGRIAVTEVYTTDAKHSYAIEHAGDNTYQVGEYINNNPYSREVLLSNLQMSQAFESLSQKVSDMIRYQHASFEQ